MVGTLADPMPRGRECRCPLEEISSGPSVKKTLEMEYLTYDSAPINVNSQTPLSNDQGLIAELWEFGVWEDSGLRGPGF